MKQSYVLYVSLYSYGLTLIPAYVINHTPCKVWDEIMYPFPNYDNADLENDFDCSQDVLSGLTPLCLAFMCR